MLSAVKTARNHYEVLGLAPTATQQEIAGAFSAAMSMFGGRPTTAAAQVCQAFAVLRSPERRKAYDRRMGLTKAPQLYPWPSNPAPQFTARVTMGGMSRERPEAAAIPAEPRQSPTESAPDPRAADQRAAEARVSELVASLRRLAEPAAPKVEEKRAAPPKPAPPLREQPKPQQTRPESIEPLIEQFLAFERAQEGKTLAGEHKFPAWGRPLLAVGGLIVGAGVLGGALGMSAIGGPGPEASVAVQLPAARPSPAPSPARPAIAPIQAETTGPEQEQAVRADAATPRTRPQVAARAPWAAAEDQQLEDMAAAGGEQIPSETVAADPLAPAPAEVAVAGARMPLPGPVVARTIRRIGYRCDRVASATAIADGPGAFLVTCRSGDSYRAAPVRGRYHFRRVGAR